MSLTKETSLAKTEGQSNTTEKFNSLQVFAKLSSLFAEKLWQEQKDAEIRQLLIDIVNAIALHLDDRFAFRCGNFFVQLDPDNKEHLFVDQNRKEAIRVIFSVRKSGVDMQTLRIPYHKKITS